MLGIIFAMPLVAFHGLIAFYKRFDDGSEFRAFILSLNEGQI